MEASIGSYCGNNPAEREGFLPRWRFADTESQCDSASNTTVPHLSIDSRFVDPSTALRAIASFQSEIVSKNRAIVLINKTANSPNSLRDQNHEESFTHKKGQHVLILLLKLSTALYFLMIAYESGLNAYPARSFTNGTGCLCTPNSIRDYDTLALASSTLFRLVGRCHAVFY